MASENFKPTYDEIQQAVKLYDATVNDTTNYDSAVNDIESSMATYDASSPKKIAEALIRVLNDWIRPNTNPKPNAIARVIDDNRKYIELARSFSIRNLDKSNESWAIELFQSLDNVSEIGGSSAGICLHLLAPSFFPSWNAEVAKAYLGTSENMRAGEYLAFMQLVKQRIEAAYSDHSIEPDVLRRIDKFNYCRVHHLM
jgi:hypothetical protein